MGSHRLCSPPWIWMERWILESKWASPERELLTHACVVLSKIIRFFHLLNHPFGAAGSVPQLIMKKPQQTSSGFRGFGVFPLHPRSWTLLIFLNVARDIFIEYFLYCPSTVCVGVRTSYVLCCGEQKGSWVGGRFYNYCWSSLTG